MKEKESIDLTNEMVNHPNHYNKGNIEVIDFIEDQELDFHLGNALKYICRAGDKFPDKEIEDLNKAIWYINRKISYLEKKNSKSIYYDMYDEGIKHNNIITPLRGE